MQNRFFTMPDGTQIFAEFAQNNHSPNLLFWHGGPGSGSWEFSYAAEILARNFNIWLPDQRGCLRSDPIASGAKFGVQTILDDLENIRQQLGIKQWSFLAHSYGGQLALLAALQNPAAVNKIIFISPSFYLLWSLEKAYAKCLDLLLQDSRVTYETAPEYLEQLAQIPEAVRRDAYYESNWPPQVLAALNQIPLTPEELAKGQRQQELLWAEGEAFKNWLPALKELKIPALLITGEYDPICEARHQEIFLQANPQNKLILLPQAGHSPHNDQPELFCRLVQEFILEQR